jgi:hypothetical protein
MNSKIPLILKLKIKKHIKCLVAFEPLTDIVSSLVFFFLINVGIRVSLRLSRLISRVLKLINDHVNFQLLSY